MEFIKEHLWLIIFVLVVLSIIVMCKYKRRTEGYSPMPSEHDFSANNFWDPLWEGEINVDCYSLNKDTCNNYASCGLCMKDGQWKCLPSDQDGPLFKEKCYRSMYTNYQERGAFGEKSTRIFAPTDYFYPLRYDTRWPSIQSIQTLIY